jgi:co-chaperonin GroES (HSP10)
MRAVNYYIVVEKIKEQQKAIEGLILTEDLDTENRFVRGKTITTGNLVEGINDEDIVYYDKAVGHGITWNGKLYHVIKANDVVLVE